MKVSKLRLVVDDQHRTRCARPGCDEWLGVIASVGGRKVHLLDPEWTTSRDPRNDANAGPPFVWHRGRSNRGRAKRRTHTFGAWEIARNAWAIPPDDVVECPRCRTIQTLPDGAAVDHTEGLRLPRVAVLMDEIQD